MLNFYLLFNSQRNEWFVERSRDGMLGELSWSVDLCVVASGYYNDETGTLLELSLMPELV